MKEILMDLLQTVLPTILGTVSLAIVGVLSNKAKVFFNTETKKNIVSHTVKFIEQVYNDIHGKDKLEKCKEKAFELLRDKGIEINENELMVLIESAVNDMNKKPMIDFVNSLEDKTFTEFNVGEYTFEGEFITKDLDRNGEI